MSEASPRQTRRDLLLERTRHLLIEAGEPRLALIERVGDEIIAQHKAAEAYDGWRRLPRSTVSDFQTGKCRRLPDWPFFRTLVAACVRLASHSGMTPALSPAALTEEFARLWKAAKIEMGGLAEPVHPPGRMEGDILEPEPGELRPAPQDPLPGVRFRMPRAWGRSGAAIMRRAGLGDANGAYQAAILLACEAVTMPDTAQDRAYLLDMAAFWHGKAIGRVQEAAVLQLQGPGLLKAARDLAAGYKNSGRPCVIFFRAFLQAEAALKPRPRVKASV